MHLFRRHDTGTSMYRIIATISSIPSPWTPSFHSTRHWIRVFIEDSTFCCAFWIVLCGLDERYWALEDMLRVPKQGQASMSRPPGYQRVSRWWQYCGWTRVWNGQERQYCQRFRLFESNLVSQPSVGQIAQLRSRTYGSSRGPWRVKPLVPVALAIPP